eukprot:jgi/Bigna1/77632/fgenesh1_pg.49_\
MEAQPLPWWAYKVPILGHIARISFVDSLLRSFFVITILLFMAEVALNILIIRRVPYTEIDWQAYMSEVQPVLKQWDFNYSHLRGDTGPLVYPGGFVWLYGILFVSTDQGQNILRAQYIFMGLYLATAATPTTMCGGVVLLFPILLIAFSLFSPSVPGGVRCVREIDEDVPVPTGLPRPPLPQQAHSFYLRSSVRVVLGAGKFFNYDSRTEEYILFPPGLFLILLADGGIWSAVIHIGVCAVVQGIVGFPFLMQYPIEYVSQSFNLARTFKRYWSVNFKWVPCEALPSGQEVVDREGRSGGDFPLTIVGKPC